MEFAMSQRTMRFCRAIIAQALQPFGIGESPHG